MLSNLTRKVSSYFVPVRTMFEIRLIRKCNGNIFPKAFDIVPKTDIINLDFCKEGYSMAEYISAKEAARRWNITERSVSPKPGNVGGNDDVKVLRRTERTQEQS